jgi:hypothetical protein
MSHRGNARGHIRRLHSDRRYLRGKVILAFIVQVVVILLGGMGDSPLLALLSERRTA